MVGSLAVSLVALTASRTGVAEQAACRCFVRRCAVGCTMTCAVGCGPMRGETGGPTAVDSRSVGGAGTAPRAGRGWGPGRAGGRKRRSAVDALRLIITIVVTVASVRSAAPPGR